MRISYFCGEICIVQANLICFAKGCTVISDILLDGECERRLNLIQIFCQPGRASHFAENEIFSEMAKNKGMLGFYDIQL